ncbi:MAG: SDR family NAD(P)-dependent oxidoreductase [Thermoflexus sp.]|uniref:SDR family NAD(P)-dependent oxidoreductase n=1 Tax=Thermoflexus sp. TaxID=1969742 RepID=UPI0025E9688A|nr:SDR family NAD(P)-dependent oxidoreductase [Thermoflexus sp.]MCS6962473.1 SDR family NAD(P)-dependent oxidoreductase [Thermoflexus sp.]MCS7352151.1 SDR family NAD(P)-dependent oxidoreductase [Thermoflexus sp.]MDW8181612.1 SDR family NAD(P)-dependent oxidoreductase [Anaerolineae bacterium]
MANAIVWGASGGIGRAIVEALTTAGHVVVAVSRRPDELSTLTPYTVYGDVTRPESVAEAVRLAQPHAPFEAFFYAAGDIASVRAADMSLEDWRRILDANLTGAFLCIQATLPYLAANAHLFFLGAIHERLRLPGLGAYAAAKAGLEAFADALRKEIRRPVTVVRPGAVATPLWNKVPFRLPPNARSPQEIAEAILQAWAEGRDGNLDL